MNAGSIFKAEVETASFVKKELRAVLGAHEIMKARQQKRLIVASEFVDDEHTL